MTRDCLLHVLFNLFCRRDRGKNNLVGTMPNRNSGGLQSRRGAVRAEKARRRENLSCRGDVQQRVAINTRRIVVKRVLIFALPLLAAGLAGSPAFAAGCLKGAVVGGVAGHFVGHHGLLGAGAGCIIGHHEAAKHARERAEQREQGSTTTSGAQSSSYSGR
jgi:hypothetical protein